MRSNSITAPDTNQRLINQFLTYLNIERGLSKNTIESYGNDLAKLKTWADKNLKAITDITRHDLRAWVTTMSRDQKLDPRSIARAISASRSFFKFLVLDRHMKGNPADGIYNPKKTHNLPKFLTEEEVGKLLSMPDTSSETGTRDRAMMELLYSSGLRASEIVTLKREDLVQPRILRITGKGNKQRLVPVGASALHWLEQYRIQRESNHNAESPFLFVSPTRSASPPPTTTRISCEHCGATTTKRDQLFTPKIYRGKPISRALLRNFVARYAQKAGLPKGTSPHTLRHTFATHLIQHGASSRVVQQLLGHASIDTTQIYTHITGDQMRATYNMHHPRNVKVLSFTQTDIVDWKLSELTRALIPDESVRWLGID